MVFQSAYYYQFERTIAAYNFDNLPGAPVTPGYPNGNQSLPYFKLHGADMDWSSTTSTYRFVMPTISTRRSLSVDNLQSLLKQVNQILVPRIFRFEDVPNPASDRRDRDLVNRWR